MKQNLSRVAFAMFTLGAACGIAGPAVAQVAGGTTTVDANVNESTKLAMGWSVKKTLMGKTVYNDAGQKVGKVEDLIISPDKNVSYVIVGAGGFVGIGRHDVAIPVSQIQDKAGRLVMAGANKDTIKNMPPFTYVTDSAVRDAYIAAAEKDIAKAKTMVSNLEKKASTATGDAKTKMDAEILAFQADIKTADTKLSTLKQATAARWREFEDDVSAATARLRKAMSKPMG